MESPLDHSFINYQVNIMQSCDQCSSYIWGMEKAYMCSCELTQQQNNCSSFYFIYFIQILRLKFSAKHKEISSCTYSFFKILSTDCKMVCHKKCLCKIVTNCSTFCVKKVGFYF